MNLIRSVHIINNLRVYTYFNIFRYSVNNIINLFCYKNIKKKKNSKDIELYFYNLTNKILLYKKEKVSFKKICFFIKKNVIRLKKCGYNIFKIYIYIKNIFSIKKERIRKIHTLYNITSLSNCENKRFYKHLKNKNKHNNIIEDIEVLKKKKNNKIIVNCEFIYNRNLNKITKFDSCYIIYTKRVKQKKKEKEGGYVNKIMNFSRSAFYLNKNNCINRNTFLKQNYYRLNRTRYLNSNQYISTNIRSIRNNTIIGKIKNNIKKYLINKRSSKFEIKNMNPYNDISENFPQSVIDSYKAAGFFIIRTNKDKYNINKKTNLNNINVQILLGFDPLKKNKNQDDNSLYLKKKKGELNILGGKKNFNEFHPSVTAYREFSEENLYIYNMFLSYFSFLYYVMKNITNIDELRNAKKYEDFLKINYLRDINSLSKEEKERIINLHIKNFMLFFKEKCLKLEENYDIIYKSSYPPSYNNKTNEILETIHDQINMYKKVQNTNTGNFKLYYKEGKYSLYFYNVNQYKCSNVLHYLNNFFWDNYTNFYYIVAKENYDFLMKCRIEKSSEYEPTTFKNKNFVRISGENIYEDLMNVEDFAESICKNKDKNFFEFPSEEKKTKIDSGYMNDLIWLDFSVILQVLIKEFHHTPSISHILWDLYTQIIHYYHRGLNQLQSIVIENNTIDISPEIISKVYKLYKHFDEDLKYYFENDNFESFLLLLFSPFNTNLNHEKLDLFQYNYYELMMRKFFRSLIVSKKFWIFLFLNFIVSIPC
ncbi:conserved Plasmodium protein, unknown function [Plasmodium relictum]|uniref:Uncharacterized protein n=1 Tax=Plasmodium relictum TaxID=85471 RepID=A0A1J1H781_PLARL|nr:conserved Plasmodium protein, unknown function [Plasmodium relictum]CRH00523.1 conserved Plasmodium protein, unknown function [Plasmodium relictum]